ncbi:hypothetical protein CYMTET_35919, partial [Cymbomonas tetramitiformis]
MESLESEISVLRRARHPNIIELVDIKKSAGKIYLVMEFCAGGDLSLYIRKHGRACESVARHFMEQLRAGLQVLRANNLIHRDLKPQNLLLTADSAQATLKIADFGFARSIQPQGLAETLCGSPLYMAPEILQCQRYDAKADLWSVGAILFEIVSARPPFGGSNHLQLLRNIERTEARLPEPVASALSGDCLDLIKQLLRRNPVERLSFEDFFCHPFMASGSPSVKSPRTFGGDASLEAPDSNASGHTSTTRSGSTSGESRDHAHDAFHDNDDGLPFFLDDSDEPTAKAEHESPGTPVNVFSNFPLLHGDGVKSAARRAFGSPMLVQEPSPTGLRAGMSPGVLHAVSSLTESMGSSGELDKEYVMIDSGMGPTECSAPPEPRSSTLHTHAPYQPHTPHALPTGPPPAGPAASTIRAQPQIKLFAAAEAAGMPGQVAGAEQPSADPAVRVAALERCAGLLGELAQGHWGAQQQTEAMSVQLLALRVLSAALELVSGPLNDAEGRGLEGSAEAGSALPGAREGAASLPEGAGSGRDGCAAACGDPDDTAAGSLHKLSGRVEGEFIEAVIRAEKVMSCVTAQGGHELLVVPDAVELTYQ